MWVLSRISFKQARLRIPRVLRVDSNACTVERLGQGSACFLLHTLLTGRRLTSADASSQAMKAQSLHPVNLSTPTALAVSETRGASDACVSRDRL